MGGAASAPGSNAKEVAKISKSTGLSNDEIGFLAKRYNGLCSVPGKLAESELPNFGSEITNRFARKLFRSLERDSQDQVNFASFCEGAARFRKTIPLSDRLDDFDFDDELGEDDIMELITLSQPGKSEAEYKALVNQFFREIYPDDPEANVLSREKFMEFAMETPGIDDIVSLDMTKLIQEATASIPPDDKEQSKSNEVGASNITDQTNVAQEAGSNEANPNHVNTDSKKEGNTTS